MKLKEMKSNVLRMIEEYSKESSTLTTDEDILNKINPVINQIMFDLCKYKKISELSQFNVEEYEILNLYDNDYIERFNQLIKLDGVDYDITDKYITFKESGAVKLYYYKNPEVINENTKDTYEFELQDDVLAIMPYGIAADLLKNDVSSNYGQIYANKYKELLQLLDPRINTGIYRIEGGIDV